ncbi:hypothetical protein CJP74_07945 [Psittacicella melopsittaci]|uniref:Uncharacterized protein n=1 Tax=Psittacicella melopsittaci TaxID=2028576 RepID=A0A3A1Y159_9GAMM|nr:hypothetical protein [Psittacicella melopsittaci]RIY31170.1 hypothetical protein CJP74_07945 [Psittacicella melopsittaci]
MKKLSKIKPILLSLLLVSTSSQAYNLFSLTKDSYTFNLDLLGNVYIENYKGNINNGEAYHNFRFRDYSLTLNPALDFNNYNLTVGAKIGYMRKHNRLVEFEEETKDKGVHKANIYLLSDYGNLVLGRYKIIDGPFPIYMALGARVETEVLNLNSFGVFRMGVNFGRARLLIDDNSSQFKSSSFDLTYNLSDTFTSRTAFIAGNLDKNKAQSWRNLEIDEDRTLNLSGEPRVLALSFENKLELSKFKVTYDLFAYRLQNTTKVMNQGVYTINNTLYDLMGFVDDFYYAESTSLFTRLAVSYKVTNYLELGVAYNREYYNETTSSYPLGFRVQRKCPAVFLKVKPLIAYDNKLLQDAEVFVEYGRGKQTEDILFTSDRYVLKDDYKYFTLALNIKF